MGEQLVLPKLAEYQPLTDDKLLAKMELLSSSFNETFNNLNNPEGLMLENKQELQASLAWFDRELASLLDVATSRGLIGESILEEV